MALVKQKHLQLYKTYIEQLITDLGKQIVLVSENVSSQCPNCIYDHVHKASSGRYNGSGPNPFTNGICPVCRNKGTINTSTSTTITGTINWGNLNENDEFVLSTAGTKEATHFKVKTFIRHYNTIKDADYITLDGVRCRLCNIIKRGLKEHVVCVAICKRDD